LIATPIATGISFWAARLGLIERWWPATSQLASFLHCLVACLAVQLFWPKEWLDGHRNEG